MRSFGSNEVSANRTVGVFGANRTPKCESNLESQSGSWEQLSRELARIFRDLVQEWNILRF